MELLKETACKLIERCIHSLIAIPYLKIMILEKKLTFIFLHELEEPRVLLYGTQFLLELDSWVLQESV